MEIGGRCDRVRGGVEGGAEEVWREMWRAV